MRCLRRHGEAHGLAIEEGRALAAARAADRKVERGARLHDVPGRLDRRAALGQHVVLANRAFGLKRNLHENPLALAGGAALERAGRGEVRAHRQRFPVDHVVEPHFLHLRVRRAVVGFRGHGGRRDRDLPGGDGGLAGRSPLLRDIADGDAALLAHDLRQRRPHVVEAGAHGHGRRVIGRGSLLALERGRCGQLVLRGLRSRDAQLEVGRNQRLAAVHEVALRRERRRVHPLLAHGHRVGLGGRGVGVGDDGAGRVLRPHGHAAYLVGGNVGVRVGAGERAARDLRRGIDRDETRNRLDAAAGYIHANDGSAVTGTDAGSVRVFGTLA